MSDGDRDWEEDFYILRKSWCPAVLTENFFMDNHSDLEYLQSRAGKQAVVDTHVEGMWSGQSVEYKLYQKNIYLCSAGGGKGASRRRFVGYNPRIRRQKEDLSYLLTCILPYNAPRIVVPKADYMGVIFYFGINLVSTLMQGTAAGIYGIRRLQIKCCRARPKGSLRT